MKVSSPALKATIDGNEATASVAYRLNEVIAIYPITPSSAMAELADEWSAHQRTNLWGSVPRVIEMQSEGGVAGALHGALQAGAVCTTFTASQGLLLMIPNMYKIAGELTPFCMHVTARTLATHALSIFGDHSDVMACRQTGFALLASDSVQEAQDMACIAHAATFSTRVPFLHFFDGFRTSHEVDKISVLSDEDLCAMIDEDALDAHRAHRLSPDSPSIRGTAQNPDVYFQSREAVNPFYAKTAEKVQQAMDRFADLTGREYRLFDYEGDPQAERVIVMMGSGAGTAAETAAWLRQRGERVGVLKVRLFRPFSVEAFIGMLPATTRSIAVLDRTKEPGALGEPLYQDVVTALYQGAAERPELTALTVVGGRYGLGSKEFTPAMVKAVFDELKKDKPRHGFTVGIMDDVTGASLATDDSFDIEPPNVVQAVFYGLGSDGTVGANKNTIKIIGEETSNCAQAYFVYDSKKSGAITISHLRFGPEPIRAPYLIRRANFVACHQFFLLEQYDVLDVAAPGATFLINTPGTAAEVWDRLPREVQESILEKNLKVYFIDAYRIARENGMRSRINTIMQVCFFALSRILPADEAIAKIKGAIEKSYGRKGRSIVEQNFAVVDQALSGLHELRVPEAVTAAQSRPPTVSESAPDFVKTVTAVMMQNKGDLLPVSAFPVNGTWPTGTSQWEKRNLAAAIPVWDPSICIQCNKCVEVCPHAAIRAKFYDPALLDDAPAAFKSMPFRSRDFPGALYSLQVAPEDCTGCELCVHVCPAKDKSNPRHKAIDMANRLPLKDAEEENFRFFLELPSPNRAELKQDVKHVQFMDPLFEFSGACAGCGETPYIKLLTQLFGDRAMIANATGCSSIYGGNLPTTPYTTDRNGRGPAWANSLFEDNAEFGLGFRLALDHLRTEARRLLAGVASHVGDNLVSEILDARQSTEGEIAEQRKRVAALREKLRSLTTPDAARLVRIVDNLVEKSVWIVGGDGWAYDIGYGGVDHVLASGENVNILVLDTEVYSNTGGQCSKATPMAASAKFSIAGKALAKKDLGLMALTYGTAYVARVAMGAKDAQTVKTFLEAEAFPGPSLIIAYSHCIAHGYNLFQGMDQQKLAVESGAWPLFRFDPRRIAENKLPLQLDSAAPKVSLSTYRRNELRFHMLDREAPERARELEEEAQRQVNTHFALYQELSKLPFNHQQTEGSNGKPPPHAGQPTEQEAEAASSKPSSSAQ
ncbi:MAG: pyruvate:ferredoxin (flavodoxin) oxidoreductase [Opitutales bacterium]